MFNCSGFVQFWQIFPSLLWEKDKELPSSQPSPIENIGEGAKQSPLLRFVRERARVRVFFRSPPFGGEPERGRIMFFHPSPFGRG